MRKSPSMVEPVDSRLWREPDPPPPPRPCPRVMDPEEVFKELWALRSDVDARRRRVEQLQYDMQTMGKANQEKLLTDLCRRFSEMMEDYGPEAVSVTFWECWQADSPDKGLRLWGAYRMGSDDGKPVNRAAKLLAEVLLQWNPLDATPDVGKAMNAAREAAGYEAIAGIVQQLQASVAKFQADEGNGHGHLIFATKAAKRMTGGFWLLPSKWDDGAGVKTNIQLILVIPQNEGGGHACTRLISAATLWAGAPTAILLSFCVNRPVSIKSPVETDAGGGGSGKRRKA